MRWSLAHITAVILCALSTSAIPSPTSAGSLSVPKFYDQASPTIATVEFVQEFVAGGQQQQTRGYTDGVVVSADGYVLVSGRIRFPQRGRSGALSRGSLPRLHSFRLHFADGRVHQAEAVGFENDLNLGILRITDAGGATFPHTRFQEGKGRVGLSLRTLTLYTEDYDRTPVFGTATVNALLSTPQEVWSMSGLGPNLLGAPLWNTRGFCVGIVAQVPMSALGGRQVVPELSGAVGLPFGRFEDFLTQTLEEHRTGRVAVREELSEQDSEAGWLGIAFQPLDDDLAKHLGISEGGGVIVSRVIPDSPAEAAGLAALDVLVEANGERIAVRSSADSPRWINFLRRLGPGETVALVREGVGNVRDSVEVTLAQAPRTELHAERRRNNDFDLTVRELTLDTQLAQRLDRSERGVVVDGVTRAGWAGLAGLRPGPIIQRINDHTVEDLDSFESAMKAVREARPDKVLFLTRHGRTTHFHVAEPDWEEATQ